jgi:hypothetical protein
MQKIDTSKREQFDTTSRVLDEIRAIYADPDPDLSTRLIRELIVHALKCRRDELEVLDLKVLSRAMAEFRYAARLQAVPARARCPFSAPRARRIQYKMAVEFAHNGGQRVHGDHRRGRRHHEGGQRGRGPENSFGVNIVPFRSPPIPSSSMIQAHRSSISHANVLRHGSKRRGALPGRLQHARRRFRT